MDMKKNDAICSMNTDFAKWYTDVCRKAELMEYSSLKGFIIYRPYGYAIWENIQNYLNKKFKETGHENVYMPMLIPQSLLQKEADHVEGFAPECAIVTKGGLEDLEEPLLIRPTSETLFCEHFSNVVNSYRDLPLKYNQWCSVVRWEKTTRPFLRGSEFLWQEGHTIHATEEEARLETKEMLKTYSEMCQDLLAIPMLTGRKTEKEKFAGAEETYTIEALMHDGKALQSGTSHYFGQGFARAFDIQYLDKNNEQQYVYQTSWGISTRLIGAIIMVHGDDNGLVLPPRVAPTQVMIVPIKAEEKMVMEAAEALYDALNELGIRTKIDTSNKTPGWKFSEAEMRGIPIRIEIGPKDVEKNECIIAKRNDGTKQTVELKQAPIFIRGLLDIIHNEMYAKALKHLQDHTYTVNTYEEFQDILNVSPGFIKAPFCGREACESRIKEETGASTRCISEEEVTSECCMYCGLPAKHITYFGKAY